MRQVQTTSEGGTTRQHVTSQRAVAVSLAEQPLDDGHYAVELRVSLKHQTSATLKQTQSMSLNLGTLAQRKYQITNGELRPGYSSTIM